MQIELNADMRTCAAVLYVLRELDIDNIVTAAAPTSRRVHVEGYGDADLQQVGIDAEGAYANVVLDLAVGPTDGSEGPGERDARVDLGLCREL